MSIGRLVLDANVLLLFVVGQIDPRLVPHHERLKQYDSEDFELLQSVVGSATSVCTTPNAWTEVSNIADFGLPAEEKGRIYWGLKIQIECLAESYIPSAQSAGDPAFLSLGLSDTALLLALDADTTLLTTDVLLFEHTLSRGQRALNFHHLREEQGLV